MILLGVLAALRREHEPPQEVPVDLSGDFSALYASTTLSGGVLVCTTTTASTGQTLPRLQRTSIASATPVVEGTTVTLAAEVRHSRALPMYILTYPMSGAGAVLSPRPRTPDTPADGWTPLSVDLTIPATGEWLGWQVVVNSATAAGGSLVGDVFEVRNFRATIPT